MSALGSRLPTMAAALVLAAAALPASAIPINFSFSHEFSGSGDSCANTSCATLSVEQVGNDVSFSLAANLASGEFITGLYGNWDPFEFATSHLLVSSIGGSAPDSWQSLSAQQDGFKADGDGYFDWTWAFNNSGPNRLNGSDTFNWTFANALIGDITNAISVNGPVGKNGFTFALRVQGLGADNEGSGWFDSNNSRPPVTVPEPMSLALFGAGLAALGFVRRRRQTA